MHNVPVIEIEEYRNDMEEVRNVINTEINNFPAHWDPHQKLDYIKVVIRTKVLEIKARNKNNESLIQTLKSELEEFNKLEVISEAQSILFNEIRAWMLTI